MARFVIILFVVVATLACAALPVALAQTDWQVFPEAVVSPAALPEFDSPNLNGGGVVQVGDHYLMVYDGTGSGVRTLGVATSPDGIHWFKYAGNPVLGPDTRGPCLLYEPEDQSAPYKLWYFDGTNHQIRYATSNDGLHWKFIGVAISRGAPGSYDNDEVFQPVVVRAGATYYMYYTARPTASDAHQRCIAVATSPDAVNWTKAGIALSPVEGNPWEDRLGCPHVLYKDGQFLMWYKGISANGGDPVQECVGFATSSDGLTFARYASNPILSPSGNPAVWPYRSLAATCEIWDGTRFRMWFQSITSNGSTSAIGYAVSAPGSPTQFTIHPTPVLATAGSAFDTERVMPPSVAKVGAEWVMCYEGQGPVLQAPIQLTADPATDWDPAWSPDGGEIAFASDRTGTFHVWSVRPDGTGLRRITPDAAPGGTPSWSPDGSQLVYQPGSGGPLCIIGRDGSGLRQLPATSGGIIPAWSPDGNWIAFGGGPPATGYPHAGDIYIARADGTELRQVTIDEPESSWFDSQPAWSPDGAEIAFVSNRGGSFGIWAIHPDGTGLRYITALSPPENWAAEAAWSPDGQWISFQYSSNVWAVHPDGSGLRQIISGGGWDGTWSPDGTRFAFTSGRSSNSDIWVTGMAASGSAIGLARSSDGINWFKYSGNPVVSPQSLEDRTGQPTVLYDPADPDGKFWRMWYFRSRRPDGTSVSKEVVSCWSADGYTWQDSQVALSVPGTNLANPNVVKLGGMYYMYTDDGMVIRLATSTDGVNWTLVGPVLACGAAGTPDEAGVYDASVLVDETGWFHMYYRGDPAGGVPSICYATSSNGTNWTKYAGNPVLPGTGNLSVFPYAATGPTIALQDGIYHLWFNSAAMIPGNPTEPPQGLGYAVSAPDAAVEPTPAGTDVTIENPSLGVSVLFEEVASEGQTLMTSTTAPPLSAPQGYQLGNFFFDISTTAGYHGPVEITLSYDDSAMTPQQEAAQRILHYNEGEGRWEDVTVALDTVNNTITARTGTLCVFALAQGGPQVIEAGDGQAGAGQTGTVLVQQQHAWRGARIEFDLGYNADRPGLLTLGPVRRGAALPSDWALDATPGADSVHIAAYSPTSTEALGEAGTLVECDFTVNPAAAASEHCTLHPQNIVVFDAGGTPLSDVSGVDGGFNVLPSSTINAALVVSAAVPGSAVRNRTQSIQITVHNTGVTTWTQADGYALSSLNPGVWGVDSVPLAPGDSIAPGQTKTFTFNVMVPDQATYLSSPLACDWQMTQGSTHFGAVCAKQVNVCTFADVTSDLSYWHHVEAAFTAGLTAGCGSDSQGRPLYCPLSNCTRAMMAVFLVRAKAMTPLMSPTPHFADVGSGLSYYGHVERLGDAGSWYDGGNPCLTTPTAGCAPGPLYCPNADCTRAMMAVFLCRACGKCPVNNPTPRFTDVGTGLSYYGFVERLADPTSWNNDPPTAGCAPGKFCPDQVATRAQMAVFLARAFQLPYQ